MPNGQWKSSTRAGRLPKNWAALRKLVLARDGSRCYVCGGHATHVDHIANSAAGGDDRLENLAAICATDHARKSSSEGGKAAQVKRPKRKRPPEPHPGLR